MYSYSQSSHRPMRTRYEFRPGRNKKKFFAGNADGKPAFDGTVQVVPIINNIEYGPYATDIYTFKTIWQGRKAARVPEASRLLTDRIADYDRLLKSVYDELVRSLRLEQKDTLIDGKLLIEVMNRTINKTKVDELKHAQALGIDPDMGIVTLPSLYEKFLRTTSSLIQPDRNKRVPGQISRATHETYYKRWHLIERYLKSIDRPKYPISAIKASFADDLKEYLLTIRQPNGKPYAINTINKVLSLLKQLMSYAKRKGYIQHNPVSDFSCRGGSAAAPKPLTEEQMKLLENASLPPKLRRMCDSWLVAAELCLHHSDFMRLRKMKIIEKEGVRYIQHDRSKQSGTTLIQTVNITERAERILARNNGFNGLYYRSSKEYSSGLKMIAIRAGLIDSEGNIIPLQFGQGRDTGLTNRVIEGANALHLTMMAGWSNPREARRYVGNHLDVVHSFVSHRKAR